MGQDKKKGKKKPALPKKPLPPFVVFANQEREAVRAETGSKSIGEVQTELSKRWKNLPLEQKTMFQERFEAEMKVFCRQLPPKKPSNSYIEFC